MRKLIVASFSSLDGVIQSPGGREEDPSGEFRFGGWICPYADAATGQALQDLLSRPFELLLGRRTYDIFASYWPSVPANADNRAIADLFNGVPKHVATHRPDTLDWQNSHALEGDLADAVRALKRVGLHAGTFDQHAQRCADHPLRAQRRGVDQTEPHVDTTAPQPT